MLFILEFSTIILLCIGSILGFIRYNRARHYLLEFRSKEVYSKRLEEDYSDIAIVIPVYNEQCSINIYFLNFLELMRAGIHVYYITTEKETALITTKDKLNILIKKYEMSEVCKIIHYPNKTGIMAHQLNYGIERINKDIIFVYNVDSKINIKVIDYVLYNKTKLKENVFQQSFICKKESKSKIINAAIMWQNRWSISYEFPKLIFSSKYGLKLINFNYAIGHGIIFSKEKFKQFGGFPEDEINEDNVLGYILCNKKINIISIPILEETDFADNLGVYIRQQSVWFNGPLYSFRYLKKFSSIENQFCSKKISMVLTACFNFKNALNWFFFPIIIDILLFILLIEQNIDFILLIMLLAIYVTAINRLSYRLLKLVGINSVKSNNLYDLLFFLFIHWIGPFITLLKIIRKTNTMDKKYKTEKEVCMSDLESIHSKYNE